MDPISLAVITVIGLWVLAAPDATTASIRSGAAAAIGSGARAAKQSIRADMAARSATRSARHKARLDRWAGKAIGPDGNPIPAPRSGPLLIKLDRIFGQGGAIESAGRRIGAHLAAAKQAAAIGWQDGKQQGRRGLPKPIRRPLDQAGVSDRIKGMRAAVAIALALNETGDQNTPPTGPPTGGPGPQPAPEGAEKESTVAKTTPTINTGAGLLPVAQEIAAATSDIGTLIAAAEANRNLTELGFDPGEEVQAAITAAAEVTPDPAALRAWSEATVALEKAVSEHATAVIGA
jgi:hypothetical protein